MLKFPIFLARIFRRVSIKREIFHSVLLIKKFEKPSTSLSYAATCIAHKFKKLTFCILFFLLPLSASSALSYFFFTPSASLSLHFFLLFFLFLHFLFFILHRRFHQLYRGTQLPSDDRFASENHGTSFPTFGKPGQCWRRL